MTAAGKEHLLLYILGWVVRDYGLWRERISLQLGKAKNMLGEAEKKECWSFPLLPCKSSLQVMLLNGSVLGILQRGIDLGMLFI